MDIHRTYKTLRSKTCCSKLRRYRLNGQHDYISSRRSYDVTEIGEGKRISRNAITQQFTLRAGGEFEIADRRINPSDHVDGDACGLVKVKRYAFNMP
jgi:hypothetical protein